MGNADLGELAEGSDAVVLAEVVEIESDLQVAENDLTIKGARYHVRVTEELSGSTPREFTVMLMESIYGTPIAQVQSDPPGAPLPERGDEAIWFLVEAPDPGEVNYPEADKLDYMPASQQAVIVNGDGGDAVTNGADAPLVHQVRDIGSFEGVLEELRALD